LKARYFLTTSADWASCGLRYIAMQAITVLQERPRSDRLTAEQADCTLGSQRKSVGIRSGTRLEPSSMPMEKTPKSFKSCCATPIFESRWTHMSRQ
jgi:hypothetical protein